MRWKVVDRSIDRSNERDSEGLLYPSPTFSRFGAVADRNKQTPARFFRGGHSAEGCGTISRNSQIEHRRCPMRAAGTASSVRGGIHRCKPFGWFLPRSHRATTRMPYFDPPVEPEHPGLSSWFEKFAKHPRDFRSLLLYTTAVFIYLFTTLTILAHSETHRRFPLAFFPETTGEAETRTAFGTGFSAL